MKRGEIEEILEKYYLGNSLDGAVDEIFELSKKDTVIEVDKVKFNCTSDGIDQYFIRRVKEKF